MASNAKAFLAFSLSVIIRNLLKPLASKTFPNHKVNARAPTTKLQRCHPLTALEQRSNHTLVIDVEGVLLKSCSLFPYFMIVAFEGGGLLRALLLLVLYPLISFLSESMALKAMVMVSFCGIKEDHFRLGRSVLPKFFLEDVSLEGFEALMKAERRVAVSGLPRVMVQGFLEEYLKVGVVLGRELKVVSGYYVGVMKDDEKRVCVDLEKVFGGEVGVGDVVGVRSLDKGVDHHFFLRCKNVYEQTYSARILKLCDPSVGEQCKQDERDGRWLSVSGATDAPCGKRICGNQGTLISMQTCP